MHVRLWLLVCSIAVFTAAASAQAAPRLPRADHGLPQPRSAPSSLHDNAPAAPCSLIFRALRTVATGSVPRALAGSPTVAMRGRPGGGTTVLQTGNRFAAHSGDGGQSWTPVDPTAMFPVLDGGFSGNQRVVWDPSRDIALWCLQYDYSAATQRGSVRVAVAREADFDSNVWFRSLVFAPQDFGRPAGERLELTDLGLSNNAVYFTANIFAANGSFRDAVVWRMKLDHVKDTPSPQAFWFVASAHGGGADLQLAHGPQETMRIAAHADTATLRIWENPEEMPTVTVHTAAVSSWAGGAYTALAPNGVNWAGRVEGRIRGGYATSAEYGFLWTAPPRAGRPLPYTRVARFSSYDDAPLGEEDIWSPDLAWMYAAAHGNAAGHRAIVLATGDGTGTGTQVPITVTAIVDDCRPTFAGTFATLASGDSSPNRPEWGDYYAIARHPQRTLGFVAGGMALIGGGNDVHQTPRFAWFGRERDDPAWSSVFLQSGGVAGVPMTVNRSEKLGRTTVPTPGYASYDGSDFYDVTAPNSHTDGAGGVWAFCNWRVRLVPFGNWLDRTPGDRDTGFPFNGTDDEAQAMYVRSREIAVAARPAGLAVQVSVDRADVRADRNGATPFQRYYKPGSGSVRLTAPASHAGAAFKRWWLDGIAQGQGVLDLVVSVAASGPARSAQAEYEGHVHGTITPYGQGCPGGNNQSPLHFSNSHADAGSQVRYEVRQVFGATNAALFLGFSNRDWNGTPLPLALDVIGADPRCALLAPGAFVLPVAIDANGNGAVTVTIWPDVPIGTHVYTQFVVVDPGAGSTLPVIVSNGLDAQTGGG